MILSTFTNIGMLDIPFKELGYCVVSAGDTLLGTSFDIRNFHPPSDVFEGVIGGPPCQAISRANRTNRNIERGMILINEFRRVVLEASPEWFLMENVDSCPDIEIEGYQIQRFILNAKHCGLSQNRNRKFQFGSKNGLFLNIQREPSPINITRCVTASEGNRGKENICTLQGLPHDFDLPDFNVQGFNRAIGNGVPLPMGRKVATAIRDCTRCDSYSSLTGKKFCICGCGEILRGKQQHYNSACRKRMQSRREQARSIVA